MRLGRRVKTKARKNARDRTRKPGSPPTPIPVSRRVLALIVALCVVALALVLYAAPSIPLIALGGATLAIVLSFPVRALSRVMPRGLAILVTFLSLVGMVVLALVFLGPLLIQQLSGLIRLTPDIAAGANQFLLRLLRPLQRRDLLGGARPEDVVSSLVDDLFNRVRALSENLLSGLVGLISGAFSFGVSLFGVLFVAVYLLVDVRKVKAAYLRAVPARYRRDARELWEAFDVSLSRYLGGLVFVCLIQGALASLALWALGVPYALLLGAWISVTAIIPYLGAVLGGIPAVILALFEGPTTAVLVVGVYLLIQQLESNLLTPRVQGQALRVHPIIVLLVAIGGGQIAGLAGVIFAIPALSTFRVLFDFFRVRLQTDPKAKSR